MLGWHLVWVTLTKYHKIVSVDVRLSLFFHFGHVGGRNVG
jgi:hypothetical protein